MFRFCRALLFSMAMLLSAELACAQSLKTTETVGSKVGLGVSSHTIGRFLPALHLGRQWTPTIFTGFSMVGAQTKAYYDSSYNFTLLFFPKNTPFWGGTLHASFGIGGFYNERGIRANAVSDDGDEEEILKDKDTMGGPAFSVEWRPSPQMYVGFDYTMGLGPGAVGMGWADVGIFCIGAVIP